MGSATTTHEQHRQQFGENDAEKKQAPTDEVAPEDRVGGIGLLCRCTNEIQKHDQRHTAKQHVQYPKRHKHHCPCIPTAATAPFAAAIAPLLQIWLRSLIML